MTRNFKRRRGSSHWYGVKSRGRLLTILANPPHISFMHNAHTYDIYIYVVYIYVLYIYMYYIYIYSNIITHIIYIDTHTHKWCVCVYIYTHIHICIISCKCTKFGAAQGARIATHCGSLQCRRRGCGACGVLGSRKSYCKTILRWSRV